MMRVPEVDLNEICAVDEMSLFVLIMEGLTI